MPQHVAGRHGGLALICAAALGWASLAAQAQTPPSEASAAAAPADGNPPPPPAPPAPKLEGALGLVLSHNPSFQGSAEQQTRLRPGLFVRYGRWTLTTTGGFVTRSHEEVPRGLTADLVRRDGLRVKLSLRFDGGRDGTGDAALAGMNDVRATVRGHLSVEQRLGDGWTASLGVNPDLLGRGGGTLANVGIGHSWTLRPGSTVGASLGLTWADRRYLQSWFGVSDAESAASGYREYHPGSGLRDIGFGLGWQSELGPRWVGFAGAGLGRLLGPARQSPLTRRAESWGVNGGLAWRF